MTVLDGLQLHRKAPPMSDFPTPLLFMDMETTGLRPDIHVPWELGYAVASHDTVNDALFVAYGGQSFIKVSDEAMYVAKAGGRGTWRMAEVAGTSGAPA